MLSISVDHTRVVLKDGDPDVPGSDYINANYISVIVRLVIAMSQKLRLQRGICVAVSYSCKVGIVM